MGTRRVAAGCLNSRRPQGSMASDDEVEKVQDEIDDLDLGMDKKKKKSKKPKDDDDDAPSKSGGGSGPNEMGPNEFYPYAEILQRVYDAISEENPELLGAKKFTMIPPQVAREGSKKTVFVDFKDMCKKMHRTMEHVMSYFNAELGVPCSLDPEGKRCGARMSVQNVEKGFHATNRSDRKAAKAAK